MALEICLVGAGEADDEREKTPIRFISVAFQLLSEAQCHIEKCRNIYAHM